MSEEPENKETAFIPVDTKKTETPKTEITTAPPFTYSDS